MEVQFLSKISAIFDLFFSESTVTGTKNHLKVLKVPKVVKVANKNPALQSCEGLKVAKVVKVVVSPPCY